MRIIVYILKIRNKNTKTLTIYFLEINTIIQHITVYKKFSTI